MYNRPWWLLCCSCGVQQLVRRMQTYSSATVHWFSALVRERSCSDPRDSAATVAVLSLAHCKRLAHDEPNLLAAMPCVNMSTKRTVSLQ